MTRSKTIVRRLGDAGSREEPRHQEADRRHTGHESADPHAQAGSGRAENGAGAGGRPHGQRADGNGTPPAKDPSEDWLARELGRLHEDVLYEPVPDDMLEILRRAEERHTPSAADPREAERQARRERALRDFRRATPGKGTSLN
jgi:hypothetical protein